MNDRKKGPPVWVWVALAPLLVFGVGLTASLAARSARRYLEKTATAPAPADERTGAGGGSDRPSLDGSTIDLSSVMGRARKLADEWDPEAALLGLEATVLGGKLQPARGGRARVTFGPSRFAPAPRRSGLYVVTYDQSGLRGAPVAGEPGPALPEPMCSPEAVLHRVSDWGEQPISLRYGQDGVERPSWLVRPESAPEQLRIFEPQACAPRGTIVVRPK